MTDDAPPTEIPLLVALEHLRTVSVQARDETTADVHWLISRGEHVLERERELHGESE